MGEENTTGAPQAGEPAQINPQGQEPTTPAEPQAGEPQKPLKSAEDYERMIADLRKENAGHRTKLKSFEDAEKQRQEAELSEKQRLEKRLADQQKEHADTLIRTQERLIASEVRIQATRLGFADPADAMAMLDRSALEYDDDGIPNNAEKLLTALLKAKPYLAGKPAAPQLTAGGATAPARSAANGPQTLTKEYVASIQRGGPQAWNALSQEEQQRISTFIRGGGLFKR